MASRAVVSDDGKVIKLMLFGRRGRLRPSISTRRTP
jgi:hypothetical protein